MARDAESAGGREARTRQGEALKDDADAARQLLGKIDRSDVKHATMTTPYGVTRGTIYKQLLQSKAVMDCADPKKCAWYLAKVLEECIPAVAVEAGKIMNLLRHVACAIAKANRGMVWTMPTGFPVVHETREPKTLRVKTADRTFVVIKRMKRGRSTQGSKRTASSPISFILWMPHTYDAHHQSPSHRRRPPFRDGARQLRRSCSRHDCLNRALREEFVRIYSEPALQNCLNEHRQTHPDVDLPELLQPGNLDIRQVIESPYFVTKSGQAAYLGWDNP